MGGALQWYLLVGFYDIGRVGLLAVSVKKFNATSLKLPQTSFACDGTRTHQKSRAIVSSWWSVENSSKYSGKGHGKTLSIFLPCQCVNKWGNMTELVEFKALRPWDIMSYCNIHVSPHIYNSLAWQKWILSLPSAEYTTSKSPVSKLSISAILWCHWVTVFQKHDLAFILYWTNFRSLFKKISIL